MNNNSTTNDVTYPPTGSIWCNKCGRYHASVTVCPEINNKPVLFKINTPKEGV